MKLLTDFVTHKWRFNKSILKLIAITNLYKHEKLNKKLKPKTIIFNEQFLGNKKWIEQMSLLIDNMTAFSLIIGKATSILGKNT